MRNKVKKIPDDITKAQRITRFTTGRKNLKANSHAIIEQMWKNITANLNKPQA